MCPAWALPWLMPQRGHPAPEELWSLPGLLMAREPEPEADGLLDLSFLTEEDELDIEGSDVSYDEVSSEVTEILEQADDLAEHPVPSPAAQSTYPSHPAYTGGSLCLHPPYSLP